MKSAPPLILHETQLHVKHATVIEIQDVRNAGLNMNRFINPFQLPVQTRFAIEPSATPA